MGWCYCKSVTLYSLELSHGVDENKGDWVRVVGQEPKQKTKTKERMDPQGLLLSGSVYHIHNNNTHGIILIRGINH